MSFSLRRKRRKKGKWPKCILGHNHCERDQCKEHLRNGRDNQKRKAIKDQLNND